jgi:hypothetical protein
MNFRPLKLMIQSLKIQLSFSTRPNKLTKSLVNPTLPRNSNRFLRDSTTMSLKEQAWKTQVWLNLLENQLTLNKMTKRNQKLKNL